MNIYRCLLLDCTGRPSRATTVSAASDEDALGVAVAHLDAWPEAVAVEIWNGERLIGYLPKLALVEGKDASPPPHHRADSPEHAVAL
jgi:hypothetical protein